MKTKFLVFLTLIYCINAFGQQQVTISEARKAAVYTISSTTKSMSVSEKMIDTVFQMKSEKNTLLYEVVFENGSNVLLSGSKACLPVLGYSIDLKSKEKESVLNNYDLIPDGLRFMIDEYIKQIEYCFGAKDVKLYYADEWKKLQQTDNIVLTKGGAIIVSPLIKSKWGQSTSNCNNDCNAYNYLVSESSSNCGCSPSRKCPAGCVAVAMAQVINYWRNPLMRFDGEQYNWNNIPDELRNSSSNYSNEKTAIAKLMRYCGIKVGMSYCSGGSCSSGATTSNARGIFVNYLGFNSSASYKSKSSYSENDWKNLIKNDLNNGWPIMYRGYDPNAGGHSFVCDGYDEQDYFHFNWGWNGSYNNYYYTLNNLSPGYNFTSDQAAIFLLRPDFCNQTLYLSDYYSFLKPGSFVPYQKIPKTFGTLISADINSSSSWRTIPSGATSEYVATQAVILKPGFQAVTGSNFKARIVSCSVNPIKSLKSSNSDFSYETFEATENETMTDEDYFTIYPNPNNGTFTISTTKKLDEYSNFRILNSTGKIVFQQSKLSSYTIQLPSNSKGVHILLIQSDQGEIIKKIIIE